MKFKLLLGFLLLSGCKSTGDYDVSASNVSRDPKSIDWHKNSELTNAPIVKKDCVENACPSDPAYELGLEKEFWRHVQREDFRGMEAWYTKTDAYTKYSSSRQARPRQMGRLHMLLQFSQGMLLLEEDLHKLVPDVNDILSSRDETLRAQKMANIAYEKSLKYLLTSLSHGVKANGLIPDDLNARTVLLVVGSFTQGAMPELFSIKGLTGPKSYVQTMYGPTCANIPKDQRSIFGELCYPNGLMGPRGDSYKDCRDRESCKNVGSGNEGLLAGAMSLVSMENQIGATTFLNMLGDGPGPNQLANCDSYWCAVNNPKDPNAPVPEATSLTPFKKIGSLLAIAEAYGKVGKLDKMEKTLTAVRKEADRLNYPAMDMIERVEKSLHGGDPARGIPDVLTAWKNPDRKKDILGLFQFPFPVSVRKGNCMSCHYGGVLPDRIKY
jgi:hypothetical protein